MAEGNISLEFTLKNIEKARNYLIKEMDQNELMSSKKKKVCTTLNYIDHFLTLVCVLLQLLDVFPFLLLLL